MTEEFKVVKFENHDKETNVGLFLTYIDKRGKEETKFEVCGPVNSPNVKKLINWNEDLRQLFLEDARKGTVEINGKKAQDCEKEEILEALYQVMAQCYQWGTRW